MSVAAHFGTFVLAQSTLLNTPKEAVKEASRLTIFQGYAPVFVVAFLVALFATPLIRRLAIANGVVDRPNEARKIHKQPIAYLGGVAVFLGILAGIFYSYLGANFPMLMGFHETAYTGDTGAPQPVPFSVVLGLTVIMVVGLIDDVSRISPRVKIGGQLFAAAALAMEKVGVQLAAGIVVPVCESLGIPLTALDDGTRTLLFHVPLPLTDGTIPIDVVYWLGTAIIGVAVLGMCNASNLIDGLDGLLSGTTAIAGIGLAVVAAGMALIDDGRLDGARLVLCFAMVGACMGFLPHNFNPANIFLGDAGSLLLGFCSCVIILTLGDTGKTHLVAAGLIIYAIPVIDMVLAIIRRKLTGKPLSAPDDQHLHHMLRRAFGVKGAVFTLYGIGVTFALLGIGASLVRARTIYVVAMVLTAYIAVTAIKIARKKHIEDEAAAAEARRSAKAVDPTPTPAPITPATSGAGG